MRRIISHAEGYFFEHEQRQRWQGSGDPMQLHENRHVKRAGEAGKALRAGARINSFTRRLSRILRQRDRMSN